jgi:hypothetical protein
VAFFLIGALIALAARLLTAARVRLALSDQRR